MPTREVTVTLWLTVTDLRKLRREAVRRSGLPAAEYREYGPAELAQFIVDDSIRLGLAEAGLQIEQSYSEKLED